MEGDVQFSFQSDDEILKARISLEPAKYAIACDAHKHDHFLSVTGVLTRGTYVHRISDIDDFTDLTK